MKGLIFTWLLTLLGVSASFIRPYHGFLVYVALAVLRPDALWSSHIQGGRFSMIVASAMLLNWFVRCCGNWDLGPARRVVLLFLAYWLWSVFLAISADSPAHAWYFVEQQSKIVLPFLVGITTVQSSIDLRRLAWVIVVCQGYVSLELNRYYFSGYNFLWEQGFASLDNNSMAIGLVTTLGVAFFLFFYETSTFRRAIIAGCAAFIGHAILFSFSRGAMLATVIFLGISFFIIRKTTLHYAVYGLGIVVALFTAGPQVRDRFMETFAQENGVREASAQSRLDLWRDCIILLADDPIMGCGPDHWPLHAHEFGWPAGKEAHSLWVQTLVELGFPGFLMYVGFFLTVLFRCWYMLQKTLNDEDAWFADSARMTIASLIGFMVSAQFVSLEALEIPYYVALLGAGSLVVHARTMQAAQQAALESAPALPSAGFANSAPVPAFAYEALPAAEPELAYANADAFGDSGPRYMNSPERDRSAWQSTSADAIVVPAPITSPVYSTPTPTVVAPALPDWRDIIGRDSGLALN
jgi:probable O-glycosylation ligase (exosortase A-associated)